MPLYRVKGPAFAKEWIIEAKDEDAAIKLADDRMKKGQCKGKALFLGTQEQQTMGEDFVANEDEEYSTLKEYMEDN